MTVYTRCELAGRGTLPYDWPSWQAYRSASPERLP